MNHQEQVAALERDIHAVIERYRNEFTEITLAAMIGVLEVEKFNLLHAHTEEDDED